MKKYLLLILSSIIIVVFQASHSYSQSNNSNWQLVLELRYDSANFRYSPQWSPNENLLIVYDWLPTATLGKRTENPLWGYRIYDVTTSERLPQFRDRSYDNLAWSSPGNYVTHIAHEHYTQINRDNYFVEIIDVATGNIIAKTGGYAHEITSIVWHPGEQYVAVSSEDGTRVWDMTGTMLFELAKTSEDTTQPILNSWHPDGTLFSYSDDYVIRIASFENPNTPLLTFYKITGELAWHPLQPIVAIGSDYKVQVWDLIFAQRENDSILSCK